MKKLTEMVDICEEPLNIGDKVSTHYQQLTRVGVVKGFTGNKVLVGFDFTCNGIKDDSELDIAKIAPFNLTKLVNQSVGLKDYFKLH